MTVFPAHAGMNRASPGPTHSPGGVPRSCGDEPAFGERLIPSLRCSPLMRG